MGIIQLVCMYCDKPYGTKEGQGKSGVSHGICSECDKLTDDERDAIANKKNAARASAMPPLSFEWFRKCP
jgi:hypothetical protein